MSYLKQAMPLRSIYNFRCCMNEADQIIPYPSHCSHYQQISIPKLIERFESELGLASGFRGCRRKYGRLWQGHKVSEQSPEVLEDRQWRFWKALDGLAEGDSRRLAALTNFGALSSLPLLNKLFIYKSIITNVWPFLLENMLLWVLP